MIILWPHLLTVTYTALGNDFDHKIKGLPIHILKPHASGVASE
jgi:hypothetical protein